MLIGSQSSSLPSNIFGLNTLQVYSQTHVDIRRNSEGSLTWHAITGSSGWHFWVDSNIVHFKVTIDDSTYFSGLTPAADAFVIRTPEDPVSAGVFVWLAEPSDGWVGSGTLHDPVGGVAYPCWFAWLSGNQVQVKFITQASFSPGTWSVNGPFDVTTSAPSVVIHGIFTANSGAWV